MFEQMFHSIPVTDVGVFPWLAGSDLKLGTGFDTLRYEPCGTAVEEKAESGMLSNTGQKVLYKLLIIEDERRFRETLSISASASIKGLSGNASARMSLFRSVKIDTYSLYVLASVSVINETVGIQQPGLTDTARQEWLRTRQPSQKSLFVKTFGDVFVTSITKGGELFALFELACSSSAEKQSLAVAISGKMGSWGGSADYQRSVEEFRKYTSTSLHIARDGGIGGLPKPDIDSLLKATEIFPEAVQTYPVPIFFETQRYARVPNLGTDIDVEARHARYKIEDLARANDDFATRGASWNYALKNPALFKQIDFETSARTVNQIEEASIKIARMADDVAENRFGNLDIYKLPSLEGIPRPPFITNGTKLPLKLHAIWLTGNSRRSNETEDGWLEGPELYSFMVKTDALPQGTVIKYMYHKGGSGDTRPITAPEMTSEGRHEFIRIWLEGPQANEYVISYEVRRAGTSATYLGENGGRAGEPGQYMRISGVKVALCKA